jgi:hypothetical protein
MGKDVHRFIASVSLVFALAVPVLAADVRYDVRPGNGLSSPVQVAPGGTVPYEVTVVVTEGDNDGLNQFGFDILTDLGTAQSVDDAAYDAAIVSAFTLFGGPFLGTPTDDDILDFAGAQGLGGSGTAGIGHGAGSVLLRGTLQTPAGVEDSFTVTVEPGTTNLLNLGGMNPIIPDSVTAGAGFVIETMSLDSDGDNVADGDDNCPNDANPGQEDGDGDEVGDVCDNCPRHENADQADCDGDAVGDVCELAQGQPVYRNAGASEGSVDARDPIAQDVHLREGADLSGFEVTYTAQFSTALRLNVSFYENDAANGLLPPDGLIAEFDYTFGTAGREEWFGASFDQSVAVGADLWFEVELDDPSGQAGLVKLVTTTAAPTIGESDGVLYKQADQSTDNGFLKFDLFADVDCNGNDLIDACEVADGTSPDCNGNGVPDDCDLYDEAADCNGNDLIDSCELADGTSADCDGNGVPDDCDPDGDGDEVIDPCDNCPETFNMSQRDADGDGIGDACDDTPGTGGDATDGGSNGNSDGGDTGLGSLPDVGIFGGLLLGLGMMMLGGWFLGWAGFFMGLVMAIVLGLSALLGGGAPPA